MKTMITGLEKFEWGETYEVRCYERGNWQHDSYHENTDDAIMRMNELMQTYDFREDELQVTKLTYYGNIVDEIPF